MTTSDKAITKIKRVTFFSETHCIYVCMCRDGGDSRRWVDDEPAPLRDRRQRSPDARREFRDSPDLRRGDGRPFGEESSFDNRGFRPHSRSPPWRQDATRDRSMLVGLPNFSTTVIFTVGVLLLFCV